MITVNPILRTFALGIGSDEILGTSFTIDLEGRQYLVTARHVIDGLPFDGQGRAEVRLKYADGWRREQVRLVGKGGSDLDVAVLAPSRLLTASKYTLLPTSEGVAMGQDCYFLGFPFGISFNLPNMGPLPHPFIKKATLSMIEQGRTSEPRRVFLDGINNPGFSGGPIVFNPHNNRGNPEYRVLGLISGYRAAPAQVHGVHGPSPSDYIRENTGIIIGFLVTHVKDFIAANPIGFPLGG